MENYLFIGGVHDGLSLPVADDADFVQWPVGAKDFEVYAREAISVGDAFIDIFRHQAITPEQVLELLIDHYKAWAVNRTAGRRQ